MARSANPQSRALWRTRLRQFIASKLTVHEFCASVGCSAPTYYYWKRKLACPESVRQYRVEERRDKAELARLRSAKRRMLMKS